MPLSKIELGVEDAGLVIIVGVCDSHSRHYQASSYDRQQTFHGMIPLSNVAGAVHVPGQSLSRPQL